MSIKNTTNGLPTITVTFLQQAMEAVSRSASGKMALVFSTGTLAGKNDTETAAVYHFHSAAEVEACTTLNAVHKAMCKRCFYTDGSPRELIASAAADPGVAFDNIADQEFSWVCFGDQTGATTFITKVQAFNANAANARKIKAIMTSAQFGSTAGDEHIIQVVPYSLTFSDGSAAIAQADFYQFMPRICAIAVNTPITESITYKILSEVATFATTATVPDTSVNLAMVDGYVRLTKGVTTYKNSQTGVITTIAMVEAKDIINEDIVLCWRNYYLGKKRNTRANEEAFCADVLGYFKELQAQGVINPDETIACEQDIDAMRAAHADYYLGKDNLWVANHPYSTECYIRAEMSLVDVMEDLSFKIYLGEV